MLTPRARKYSLWDGYGPWCAWCFRYFDLSRHEENKQEIENHHMAEQSFVRDHLGRNYTNKWVVPVHGTFAECNCHRMIGRRSNRLNSTLKRAVFACQIGDIQSVVDEATRHHVYGSGSISQLLKFVTLRRALDDYPANIDQIAEIITFLYATGPGLRWGYKLNISQFWRNPVLESNRYRELGLTSPHEIEETIYNQMLASPRFRINLAKLVCDQNDRRWSDHLNVASQLISSMRGEEKESIETNIKRATASIYVHRPGFSDAELRVALDGARDALANADNAFVRGSDFGKAIATLRPAKS